jgi:hypothetical protein
MKSYLRFVARLKFREIEAAFGSGTATRDDFVDKWLRACCTDDERKELWARWNIEKD